jgi:hypothetical protein
MEAVPVFGRDVADDAVLGPLWGYGFPERNRNEEAGFGTFCVNGWVDGAGFVPGVGVLGDVLVGR